MPVPLIFSLGANLTTVCWFRQAHCYDLHAGFVKYRQIIGRVLVVVAKPNRPMDNESLGRKHDDSSPILAILFVFVSMEEPMKESIILSILLLFAVSALILAAKRRISNGIAVALVCSALIAGWFVSHRDWLNFLGIAGILRSGGDLKNEVGGGKKPMPTMADISALLEKQQKTIDALSESNSAIHEKLNASDQQVKELQENLEQAKREVAALQTRSSELALMLTRIIWLQLEALDDSDGERAGMAVQKILDEMDSITTLAIEDPAARARFVDDVKKALPPKR